MWFTDYYGEPRQSGNEIEYDGYVWALAKPLAKLRVIIDVFVRDLPMKLPESLELEEIHRGLLTKGYRVKIKVKR
jgi:hypothetical protein